MIHERKSKILIALLMLGGAVALNPRHVQAGLTNAVLQAVGAAPAGSTASGNPLLLAGVDSSSTVRTLRASGTGQLLHAPAASAYYISTNSSTLLKTGAGSLRTVVIANLPGTSPSCTSLYDGVTAAGQLLGQVCPLAGSNIAVRYDVSFGTGLVAVQAGANAAGLTITWD